VKAFVRNPEAVAALVMAGAAAGGAVMVSAKVLVADPPVPLAVSVISVVATFAVVGIVPEITPPERLKYEGKGEVVYTGDATPEDVIVYEKG
jgi:hypothetical protein